MDLKEQLKSLSAQDRKELLKQLQQEEKESKRNRRDAYEGLRAQFMLEVKNRLLPVVDDVKAFRDWVEKEAAAFRAVMREYGQLRKDEQASFTIVDGDMKLAVAELSKYASIFAPNFYFLTVKYLYCLYIQIVYKHGKCSKSCCLRA